MTGIRGKSLPTLGSSSGALYWNGSSWSIQAVDTNPSDDLTTSTSFNGDVTGTYNSIKVVGIQGNPVSSTTPSNGQVLKWNGSQWEPAPDLQGITGSGDINTIPIFTGSTTLGNSEISQSGSTVNVSGDLHVTGTITSSSTITGTQVYASKFVDSSNNNYSVVPSGTSELNQLNVNKINGATPVTSSNISQYAITSISGSNGVSTSVSNGAASVSLAHPSISCSSGALSSFNLSDGSSNCLPVLTTSTNFNGDVTGTYNSIKVVGIQGNPVSSTTPSDGQVLKWLAGKWTPAADLQGITSVQNGTGISVSTSGGTATVELNTNYTDSRYVNEGQANSITSSMIVDGTITNADISDSTKYVSVQNSSGTEQFSVTDGSPGLRFAGSGIVGVSFNSSSHTVTISASESDPQVGSTTNGYVCYGTGSQVTCDDSDFKWDSSSHVLTTGGLYILDPSDTSAHVQLSVTTSGGTPRLTFVGSESELVDFDGMALVNVGSLSSSGSGSFGGYLDIVNTSDTSQYYRLAYSSSGLSILNSGSTVAEFYPSQFMLYDSSGRYWELNVDTYSNGSDLEFLYPTIDGLKKFFAISSVGSVVVYGALRSEDVISEGNVEIPVGSLVLGTGGSSISADSSGNVIITLG